MQRLALVVCLCWLVFVAGANAQLPITIPSSGSGSPYPSVLDIGSSPLIIEDLDVRVTDLAHDFPDDLDIALVGPDGTSVMLMSDVGEAPLACPAADLQFSSEATGPVPSDVLSCSGVYQPTDDDSDGLDLDLFPDPGPAGAPGNSLTAFNGQRPAGAWKLFVVDDADFDSGGSIASWTLRFNTRALGLTRYGTTPTITRSERDGVIPFAIRRSGGSATAPLQAASVDWVAEGCQPSSLMPAPPAAATVGSDFLPAGGSVALAPNQTDATAEVGIVADEVPELRECVSVRLTGVTGDARLSDQQFTLVRNFTITDDDPRASRPKVTARPGQRVLRQRAVVVTAESRVTGKLSATGTIALPRAASAAVRLKPATANVPAGGSAKLRLRLSKKALKTVKRAFRSRRTLTATIRVTETDLAGGRATTLKRVRLRGSRR
jgi:subtilisin-like proprotein convertase family protein